MVQRTAKTQNNTLNALLSFFLIFQIFCLNNLNNFTQISKEVFFISSLESTLFDYFKGTCTLINLRNDQQNLSNLCNDQQNHRCTVVGYPRWDRSLGFWPNSFEGGTLGCQKSRLSPFSCFIVFLCHNFSDLTPHPLCAWDEVD